VLDSKIDVGHVIIPTSAIRDEGTSYHYMPPSREVEADKDAVQAIMKTLDKHGVPYDLGKTWTTDAIYRETPQKVKKRREEGAITVEMEAATFFAVAQFRGVQFGQLLYGGDDLGGEAWDRRNWYNLHDTREKLLWLAVESVLAL
jgi:uridine phosphorylase